jgi:hypothetical protein
VENSDILYFILVCRKIHIQEKSKLFTFILDGIAIPLGKLGLVIYGLALAYESYYGTARRAHGQHMVSPDIVVNNFILFHFKFSYLTVMSVRISNSINIIFGLYYDHKMDGIASSNICLQYNFVPYLTKHSFRTDVCQNRLPLGQYNLRSSYKIPRLDAEPHAFCRRPQKSTY